MQSNTHNNQEDAEKETRKRNPLIRGSELENRKYDKESAYNNHYFVYDATDETQRRFDINQHTRVPCGIEHTE